MTNDVKATTRGRGRPPLHGQAMSNAERSAARRYRAEDEAEKAATFLMDVLIDYSTQHTHSYRKTLGGMKEYEIDLTKRFIARTAPGFVPYFEAAVARGRPVRSDNS